MGEVQALTRDEKRIVRDSAITLNLGKNLEGIEGIRCMHIIAGPILSRDIRQNGIFVRYRESPDFGKDGVFVRDEETHRGRWRPVAYQLPEEAKPMYSLANLCRENVRSPELISLYTNGNCHIFAPVAMSPPGGIKDEESAMITARNLIQLPRCFGTGSLMCDKGLDEDSLGVLARYYKRDADYVLQEVWENSPMRVWEEYQPRLLKRLQEALEPAAPLFNVDSVDQASVYRNFFWSLLTGKADGEDCTALAHIPYKAKNFFQRLDDRIFLTDFKRELQN